MCNNVLSHYLRDVFDDLRRSISSNQLISIESGAFTGLGSLTELCVTVRCHLIGMTLSH